ncbi:SDR family oxidoreductase [Paucibacter sp. DJ1R-11]|uniref:SDR family NAD(P)-dependent oxidoreductase n=1 Tax=unclassified Roseateles TaxID=2626991 RepID=UPI0021E3E56F|nr:MULTISPECIES: SDR family oxidoreductase [unclassified Roseateles]MCV2362114.1 SDR family oxidoreductase [Paucibacter sp. DJ1R-11]MCV2419780.1 SDR family oxidoreductase [Paucibacter sp. DJ4R-1]MCV2437317.1 SDR family oxidoreductase [Paucibacter sp. DJ2R-2]
MDLGLKGLRAVVTGGSAGIGAAIVRALAAEGCEVAFCARQPERLQACLAELQSAGLPGTLQARALDVCQPGAFEAWLEELGTLDILVLNVSALSSDWSQALDVDLRATVRCAEAALPLLRRSKHGALTYIGSKAGSLAAPNSAAYGAAKAALAHYMKSLSARVLPEVRVNTVSPGDTWVAGGLWGRVQEQEPELYARVLQRNPLQRLARPDEIARVACFVSSPAASFVAGANWYVDGGSTAHVQF